MSDVAQDQVGLTAMQRYIAMVATTPSALRNLGARGLVRKSQEFLALIELKPLRNIDPAEYPGWLDRATKALEDSLQMGKYGYGPARKAMNIFMVMASLNRYLCGAFALDHLKDVLEVPLDNRVAKKLLKWARRTGQGAPRWRSIKKLDPATSGKLQSLAGAMDSERRIPRGLLDVELWSRDYADYE